MTLKYIEIHWNNATITILNNLSWGQNYDLSKVMPKKFEQHGACLIAKLHAHNYPASTEILEHWKVPVYKKITPT